MILSTKKFNRYTDHTGSLVPFYKDKSLNNFNIKRFFFLYGKTTKPRADHAHKKCNQIYIPIHGCAHIEITNVKNNKKKIKLNTKNKKFLFVPVMHWIKINFSEKNSILLVLCDYKYEEKEYIRNKKEFLK